MCNAMEAAGLELYLNRSGGGYEVLFEKDASETANQCFPRKHPCDNSVPEAAQRLRGEVDKGVVDELFLDNGDDPLDIIDTLFPNGVPDPIDRKTPVSTLHDFLYRNRNLKAQRYLRFRKCLIPVVPGAECFHGTADESDMEIMVIDDDRKRYRL